MARNVPIKWRKIDQVNISNLARVFNAKITRVSKDDPVLAPFQPKRINAKELADELKNSSRNEYNRRMAQLKRYMKKGSEELSITKSGVVTTKYQLKELQYAIQSINAINRSEIKRLGLSKKNGEMGSIPYNELMPRVNNSNKITPDKWNNYLSSVEKQIKGLNNPQTVERYKHNYLDAMANKVGTDNDLYRLLMNTPAQQMVDAYFSNSDLLSIDFWYTPEDADKSIKVATNNWKDFLGVS